MGTPREPTARASAPPSAPSSHHDNEQPPEGATEPALPAVMAGFDVAVLTYTSVVGETGCIACLEVMATGATPLVALAVGATPNAPLNDSRKYAKPPKPGFIIALFSNISGISFIFTSPNITIGGGFDVVVVVVVPDFTAFIKSPPPFNKGILLLLLCIKKLSSKNEFIRSKSNSTTTTSGSTSSITLVTFSASDAEL